MDRESIFKTLFYRFSRIVDHSIASITCPDYGGLTKAFFLLCKQKGMRTEEVAFSIGRTVRLVKEYEVIIEGYKEKNYILEALLNSEIGTESRFQASTNDLNNKGLC